MFDAEDVQPWHRRPDETDISFNAFSEFLALGHRRNLEELGRRLYPSTVRKAGSTTVIRNWSVKFSWRHRARAYDDHFAQIRRDEELRQQQYDLDELAERRRVVRDQAWDDCQRMREEIVRRFNPPDGGKQPTTADVKNLALALDKLNGTIDRLSKGLESTKPGQTDNALPPDMAAAFQQFLVDRLGRQEQADNDVIPFKAAE